MSIWKRYFYKEFLTTVCFILFSIYALYVLVDLMAHLKAASSSKSSVLTWVEYYLSNFSKRLDILIPFSILIATIRCLYNFQTRGELVAMLASGISRNELLKPFLVVACSFSILLYANYEWVLPSAIGRISTISETRFGKEELEEHLEAPKEVMLDDGSKLIYTSYSRKNKEFQDVFWMRSVDHIFHMRTLNISSTPEGKGVDEIVRTNNGKLESIKYSPVAPFNDMHFDSHALKNSVIPPQEQSLWELAKQSLLYFDSSSSKASEIKSYLFYRLTFPLMCLLAFIAPAPFCMRFTRHAPILMTYLVAIASLFCMSLILQAALSIGKNQLVAPYVAIAIPWLLASYFFGKQYLKI